MNSPPPGWEGGGPEGPPPSPRVRRWWWGGGVVVGGSHSVPEAGGENRRWRLWGSRGALQGRSPSSVCGQATQSTHKPRGPPQGRRLRKHWTAAVALDFSARSSAGMLPVLGCGPRPFPRTPRGCIGLSAQPILRRSAVSAGSWSLATSISVVLTSPGSLRAQTAGSCGVHCDAT